METINAADAKTPPLCTSTELNLADRVCGEVEKNSFIALPGKGGHSGLMPSKLCVPPWGGVADKDEGLCRALVPSVQISPGIRRYHRTVASLE